MNEQWTVFGERLKAELERQGMSYRTFSAKVGLTLTTTCRYAKSERIPRANEILKTAKVLGVTCDYLLGLSDDPHLTSKSEVMTEKEQRDADFWRRRAEEYSDVCLAITAEMTKGIKFDSIRIDENGIAFGKERPEIIHCGECRFREIHGNNGYCDHITGEEIMVRKDEYCSWAERRTDGQHKEDS